MNATIFVYLNAIPLDEQIKQGHGVSQTTSEIGPSPMHHFFEMTNERQHRQDGFHNHTCVPLASLTYLQIVGVPVFLHKAFIGKDDHVRNVLIDHPLEGCAIVHVDGSYVSVDDQAQIVQTDI